MSCSTRATAFALSALLALPAVAQASGPDGICESARLSATGRPQPGARFGAALALAGDAHAPDVALVGAPGANAAHVFERVPATHTMLRDEWAHRVDLAALADVPEGSAFGASVALTSDTTLALVGAPDASVDEHVSAGAVRTFLHADGLWTTVGELAHEPAAGARFGSSLALEGALLAVGAPGADRVHLFVRDTGGWQPAGTLTGPEGSGFGTSVDAIDAVLGGPTRVVVGAPGAQAVQVFRFEGGAWVLEAELEGDGTAVAIDETRGPGSTGVTHLLVGAPAAGPEGARAGEVLRWRDDGTGWEPRPALRAPYTSCLGARADGDRTGAALALDGATALLGSPGDRYDPLPSFGATGSLSFAALGLRVEEGDERAWSVHTSKLCASDLRPGDELGAALALSGGTLLAGAPGAHGGAGYAYLYEAPACTLRVSPAAATIDGTLRLTFDLDLASEGNDPERVPVLYWLAGSISGTWPGVLAPNNPHRVRVPVRWDAITGFGFRQPHLLSGRLFLGALDREGRRTIDVRIPGPFTPDLVGRRASHAFVLFDEGPPVVFRHASNAATIVFGARGAELWSPPEDPADCP